MANLTTAYILWFCGGILGLHHLYLNRPRQCFIWFVTWGGMLLGWLSEVTQIRDYVEEANQSKEYREKMKAVRKHCPKPGFNVMLLGSQLMIGHQLGKLFICALPEYYTVEAWYAHYLSHLLAAIGGSIGVYLASNIGAQQAPFLLPFLASLATIPSALVLYNRRTIYTMVCVVAASVVSGYFSRWTTRKRPSNLIGYLKVVGVLSLGLITYGALWTSNIYHNTTVHTLNGTKIHLRDAISNFIKTQPWDEAHDVLHDVIPCLRMYSMDSCQYQILSRLAELSDPERDAWAFSVLGFEKYPSQKEVTSHCRKLSSKWHPDRFTRKNETEKQEAEQKFLDIQKACSMMDKIRMNRERKNTWASSATEQSETVYTESDDERTYTDDVNNNFDDDTVEYSGDELEEEMDEEYDDLNIGNVYNADNQDESFDANSEREESERQYCIGTSNNCED